MKNELVLNQFPTTKEGIKNHLDHFLMEVEQGNINKEKAFIEVVCLMDYFKAISDNLKKYDLDFPKKQSSYYGAVVTERNLADKYDYTNDHIIYELEQQKKEIESKIKARKQLMDIARKTQSTIYDDEGIEIKPPKLVKYGGVSYTTKLA